MSNCKTKSESVRNIGEAPLLSVGCWLNRVVTGVESKIEGPAPI